MADKGVMYEVAVRFVDKAQAEEYRDKIAKRFGLYMEKLREIPADHEIGVVTE